ncbi:MAG: sigma 54-interacting transcriptional regulator [Eubacterium sp.]|nr:sigma 54-interacting transcriptional regulator [Eubacterium sp.]
MFNLSTVLVISQLIFSVVAIIYFVNSIKNHRSSVKTIRLSSEKEGMELRRLRNIRLTEPLSEKARPKSLDEIVGQEKGIEALRAALMGENPQHVIIYGPPGVGKTAVSRLILEEAKHSADSPFKRNAPFVELDSAILQFDERNIADPLMGSVHDPIYQGAGAYGSAGVPRPKPGAVTKAHGGILFLDEIGELHPYQLNRLLKVLEDRKVYLNSSYYSPEDENTPPYIHDVFKNGLPADFRLVGATTKSPHEIPEALRSRCREVFFSPLTSEQVEKIAADSCTKAGFNYEERVPGLVSEYCENGRSTVNIIQTAASVAKLRGRKTIKTEDILKVADFGRFTPVYRQKLSPGGVGVVTGLAVTGGGRGCVLPVEAVCKKGRGSLNITGIVEKEEINSPSGKLIRKGTAFASAENALTVLNTLFGIDTSKYDFHINFPGGVPVDGPSAGIAVFCAMYSAVTEKPLRDKTVMTGELGLRGDVLPVGGIEEKLTAGKNAGAEAAIIPRGVYDKKYEALSPNLISAENITEVVEAVFEADISDKAAHKIA